VHAVKGVRVELGGELFQSPVGHQVVCILGDDEHQPILHIAVDDVVDVDEVEVLAPPHRDLGQAFAARRQRRQERRQLLAQVLLRLGVLRTLSMACSSRSRDTGFRM